jgi:hypothetical protein
MKDEGIWKDWKAMCGLSFRDNIQKISTEEAQRWN